MTKKDRPRSATNAGDNQEILGTWYTATLDQALIEAKATKKSVLLYWGAVWCPPCAEIKSQVFSHPEFPALVQDMLTVYIDGDSEGAQNYSDRFNVQGYPTLLVLNDQGKELMRIDHGVSFTEFAAALSSAIATAEPIQALVTRARAGHATDLEWTRIAFQYGEEFMASTDSSDILLLKLELYERCPSRLVAAKARLAGRFLAQATKAKKSWLDKDATTQTKLQTSFVKAAEELFSSPESVVAARSVIIYQSASVISLIAPDPHSDLRKKWITTWLRGAAELERAKDLSLDTRLWAVYPELALHRAFAGNDAPVPLAIRNRVVTAAQNVDRQAFGDTQRKAVISGAAYLLQLATEYDHARTLLRKELMITTTPWYYHSSLSSLEQAAGNLDQALVWSEKARVAAAGRATKIQWIVDDLRLTARTAKVDDLQRLVALISEYYDTAFGLSDGFSGRNALRAKLVAEALIPWSKEKTVANAWQSYQEKCSLLETRQARICTDHFATLVNH